MKDFYDILFLAEHEEFGAYVLSAAINQTFSHRGTNLNQAQYIFAEDFKNNKALNEMWRAFLKRSDLAQAPTFPEVLVVLNQFLSVANQAEAKDAKWSFEAKKWL